MGVPNDELVGDDDGSSGGTPSGDSGGYLSPNDLELIQQLEQRVRALRDLTSRGGPTNPEVLLKSIIGAMCDHPEDVRFDAHITKYTAGFDVHLHADDVSKVLGSGGSHAQALRILFSAIYGKHGKKLYLMIVNPNHRR